MGARIAAQKIAVYMDASGSMVPYLSAVVEEIQRQFPDADFFNHNGGFIFVEDGKVVGGRRSRLDETMRLNGDVADQYQTKVAGLSSTGKSVFRRYDEHFRSGGLGAWIDVMLSEKYDAIIVFSDFQDGVRQIEGKDRSKIIYFDGNPSAEKHTDTRKPAEMKWEENWIQAFTTAQKGEAPKLYLFSTSIPPQSTLRKCVEASTGQIQMVTWLNSMPEALIVLRAHPAFSAGAFSQEDFSKQVEASRPAFRSGRFQSISAAQLLGVLVQGERIKRLDDGKYLATGVQPSPSSAAGRSRASGPPR